MMFVWSEIFKMMDKYHNMYYLPQIADESFILVPFYQVQPANFRTENREPASEDIIVGASGHVPIDGGQGIR